MFRFRILKEVGCRTKRLFWSALRTPCCYLLCMPGAQVRNLYSNGFRFEMGWPVRECKMGYRLIGNVYTYWFIITNHSGVLELAQIYRCVASNQSWLMRNWNRRCRQLTRSDLPLKIVDNISDDTSYGRLNRVRRAESKVKEPHRDLISSDMMGLLRMAVTRRSNSHWFTQHFI